MTPSARLLVGQRALMTDRHVGPHARVAVPAAGGVGPLTRARSPSSDALESQQRLLAVQRRRCSSPMPLPPECSTRWHGTTIGIGFDPSALPAARARLRRCPPRRPRRVGRDLAERDPRVAAQHPPAERARQRPVERRGRRRCGGARSTRRARGARRRASPAPRACAARPRRDAVEDGVGAARVVLVGERARPRSVVAATSGPDRRVDERVGDVGVRGGREARRGGGRGGRVEGGRRRGVRSCGRQLLSQPLEPFVGRAPGGLLGAAERRPRPRGGTGRRRSAAAARRAAWAAARARASQTPSSSGSASSAPARRGRRRSGRRGARGRGGGRAPCGARSSGSRRAGSESRRRRG